MSQLLLLFDRATRAHENRLPVLIIVLLETLVKISVKKNCRNDCFSRPRHLLSCQWPCFFFGHSALTAYKADFTHFLTLDAWALDEKMSGLLASSFHRIMHQTPAAYEHLFYKSGRETCRMPLQNSRSFLWQCWCIRLKLWYNRTFNPLISSENSS